MKKFQNLFNFVFTVVITLAIFLVLRYLKVELSWCHYVGIFFVSYPWMFNQNIYSLFGGINMDGSVDSAIGIFQIAGNNANCAFGLSLFQKAGNNAYCVFGLSLFQQAGNNATCVFGLPLFQKAEKQAYCGFGIAINQSAEEKGYDYRKARNNLPPRVR